MRSPSWESSAGALAAFLNTTTQVYMVDLFTFTLTSGAVVRWTSADQPVTVNGNTYLTGPVITRDTVNLEIGITVDSFSMTLAGDSTSRINGAPLFPAIAGGVLDGARLAFDRAFTSAPGQAWIGTLGLFSGRVSDTTVSRYEADLTINSDSELLNVMVPRNVYAPGCGNTLFDATCGLSKSTYAVSATATSATDAAQSTFRSNLPQTAGYFALGWAVCNTGANAGTGRTIKAFASVSGAVTTIQPWPLPVSAGDTFTVYPGCDKTQATCLSKFNNVIHFRGQPYVPAPETIA